LKENPKEGHSLFLPGEPRPRRIKGEKKLPTQTPGIREIIRIRPITSRIRIPNKALKGQWFFQSHQN